MEYPIFRQNHVNSGFSWGKLVVMIWTMKRWDTTQEVCNGDTKQQTMGMWTDNHGTWNNINMNKSMWWFRAITSLGVNKWIMKCQKHETNFPFGFFFLNTSGPNYLSGLKFGQWWTLLPPTWDARHWSCHKNGLRWGWPRMAVQLNGGFSWGPIPGRPQLQTNWGLPEKCRLREWSCSAAWQKGLTSATTVPVPAEGFDIGMGKPQT